MRSSLRGAAILAFLVACKVPAPESKPSIPFDAESAATRIDAEVAAMRLDTASIEGQSTEGGQVEAAYRDSALQRLRVDYYGETGRAVELFYFDSALFFVKRVDSNCDEPLSGRVISADTTRYELRSAATTQTVRDSLFREVRTLLDHLAAARR